MADIEPITRKEKLLAGEDITPITHTEKIIAGEDLPAITHFQQVYKKYGGGSTPTGKITITENGTDINIAQYATADVAVSSAELGTKNITANGTYAASEDNLDGYSAVTVNVPMPDEYCIGGSLADKTLTDYKFKNGVTQIPYEMFKDCSRLGTMEIPDTVATINTGAFAHDANFDLVKLPDQLITIGQNAFNQCFSLSISVIPSGVQTFGLTAFSECTGITSMKFLGDITSIPYGLFYRCSNCLVYDFTNNTGVPTLINITAFEGINANCKIVVPDALFNDWVGATNWVNFDTYIVKESEYVA